MEEVVLEYFSQILCSVGPRAKTCVLGTKMGDLVLTTSRLLFLAAPLPSFAQRYNLRRPHVALGQTTVEDLDLDKLENSGSIDLALDQIISAEVTRRWDFACYLSLHYRLADGGSGAFAFMTWNGFRSKWLRSLAAKLIAGKGAHASKQPAVLD